MGRPSKLTEAQWAEVERRHLAGEGIRELAREFKIAPGNISRRVSKPVSETKAVAKQLATAEMAFAALPVSQQIATRNLADELKAISGHLASAARYGAATAHRLSALAHSEVQKVDDGSLLESMDTLKGVAGLTKMVNDSAAIGLNLLAANKEGVKRLSERDAEEPDAPPMSPDQARDAVASGLEKLLRRG